jgi:hypothetical protein
MLPGGLSKGEAPEAERRTIVRDYPAAAVALSHIKAWSRHDRHPTKELLAPNAHAVVITKTPIFGGSGISGIDQ